MVKVKICGISRKIDIEYINKHLPSFIGFVFAKSKRQVSSEHVRILKETLDHRVKTVGVFVNEEIDKVLNIADECNLDVIQLHGDESPEYVSRLVSTNQYDCSKFEVWKAIRVKDADCLTDLAKYNVDGFLLDTYIEGIYGGAGKVFDWNLALDAKKYGNIILAGGLNSQNIQEALRIVQPYAVDTSSGVETDGYKDENSIKEFIDKVRN